ncbi:polyhydroxyalkanoate depolymerase [Sphingomonas profundi]|uniref:polyhydroxyalkanoate depolymerase n=1 Tax=Alterirhizorhabdus profundi TaxID=2681549 RepID=UPI0012E82355|nr:polyhydroxyalkanoate depolymerase [Sphingomonas profundi]
MLYGVYQGMQDALEPLRLAARAALSLKDTLGPVAELPVMQSGFAFAEMVAETRFTHARPGYGIGTVLSGNMAVPVREEVAASLPFGDLLHFAKDGIAAPQPKMLVVAPLSGHYATLLRETVRTLLRDHDVYITDWKNARDVPLSAGRFGFADYTDYIIDFLERLGPRSNVLAVCQPCVPTLAAVAIMAEDRNPAQPRTMTLMGGPVDVRVSPTVVNDLATSKPLDWFERQLISRVPWRYEGRGRRVYPGFLQLIAFMSMNMARHGDQHRLLYQHLADGELVEAAKIRDFYEEYYAVLDLTAEFYLETVDIVFQRALLAKGEMTHRGRPVNPAAIQRTALLTVEGERDDICAVGQTAAAHGLCSSLRPHLKRHHLQPGVGHYGVFAGRRWDTQVYPQVRNLVLAMA